MYYKLFVFVSFIAKISFILFVSCFVKQHPGRNYVINIVTPMSHWTNDIQSTTYEWTLDKLYVNRTWSVFIGKYEFVCCAEQTITYEWTSDKLYVEADETFWELCARGCVGRPVLCRPRPHTRRGRVIQCQRVVKC